MFSHGPENYHCPFCAFMGGHEDAYSEKQDIIYSNAFATAFIAPKWWINNAGHVLVIPR
jgi:histidine triad (HIT) family protein